MKRVITIIISMALLLTVWGCGNKSTSFDVPVSFFYCARQTEYDASSPVILSETREAKDFNNDVTLILNSYLQGPESESLINPFPDNLCVESFSLVDNTFHITLSPNIAKLSGLNLTLACACLSKTIIEFIGCDGVTIYALDSSFDGNNSITMTRENLMLNDTFEENNDQ